MSALLSSIPVLLAGLALPARSTSPAGTTAAEAAPALEIGTPAPPGGIDLARWQAELDQSVHYDVDQEGTLWSRGAHWKMSFDGEKATYFPLLGARQEAPLPHVLSPDSASVGGVPLPCWTKTEVHRTGDRVELARGSFLEVYELTPDSLEQLFVFPVVPAGGDLVLHIPTGSTLEREEEEAGLHFRSELGGLRYSRAVAIDARGARRAASTRFVGDAIEIRVDEAFLAGAEAPLTIDPVVLSYSVDNSSYQDTWSDVAYDPNFSLWLVVWERTDGSEKDIAFKLIQDYNYVSASGYVNIDSQSWTRPSCANNNGHSNFYVVATVPYPGASKAQILGRTVRALNGDLGAVTTVAPAATGQYCLNAKVGGESRPYVGTNYCVIWEMLKSNGDTDIWYRRVPANGVTLNYPATTLVSSIYPEVSPTISKSNDGREWAVAYCRDGGGVDTLYAGRIKENGTISGYPYMVFGNVTDTVSPSVSTMLNGTTRFLVACTTTVSKQKDIELIVMDGYTKLGEFNLGALEFGGNINFAHQVQPKVESNGGDFMVAYTESNGSDQNVFGSAVRWTGSGLALLEGRVNLRVTSNKEFGVAIASKEASGAVGSKDFMVTFNDYWPYGNAYNIGATLYRLP